jgi:DNA-binding NarL/FixJ family response regulator
VKPQRPEPVSRAPTPGGAPIRIAAVDDHPVVLYGLTGQLGEMPGFVLAATATNVDALLDDPAMPVDVVLLDLDLGAGTDVAKNIHRIMAAGSKIVVFSVSAVPRTVREAMRAGATSYVQKTESIDELATAIRAAAEGGGWVSRQLAFLLYTDDSPDRPALSEKELEALRLYAQGLPMKSVARRMDIGTETAKQYIDRVRFKYRRVGREAGTKIDLYRRAVEDGHLPQE